MIFKSQNRWWLLTNESTQDDDCNSVLSAYYSTDPISGNWSAHHSNPIVINSLFGRNGGILDAANKFPIRVRQRQGFAAYGEGFSFARIENLTPSSFIEHEIRQVKPNIFPDIKGCHHMNSHNDITVFDYLKYDNLH